MPGFVDYLADRPPLVATFFFSLLFLCFHVMCVGLLIGLADWPTLVGMCVFCFRFCVFGAMRMFFDWLSRHAIIRAACVCVFHF